MMDCLFCKLRDGDIPSKVVYEDKDAMALLDIMPVKKGHVLVIPKRHCTDLLDMPDDDASAVMSAARKVGRAMLKAGYEGFNVQMNNKEASGQVIFHAHVHVVPRKKGDGLKLWPGHSYDEGEMKEYHKKLISCMQES